MTSRTYFLHPEKKRKWKSFEITNCIKNSVIRWKLGSVFTEFPPKNTRDDNLSCETTFIPRVPIDIILQRDGTILKIVDLILPFSYFFKVENIFRNVKESLPDGLQFLV